MALAVAHLQVETFSSQPQGQGIPAPMRPALACASPTPAFGCLARNASRAIPLPFAISEKAVLSRSRKATSALRTGPTWYSRIVPSGAISRVVGKLSTPNAFWISPESSIATLNSIPTSRTKASTRSFFSSASMPSSRSGRPAISRLSRFSSGISTLHGPHQVAKKLRITTSRPT
jgi:hypothetical protein